VKLALMGAVLCGALLASVPQGHACPDYLGCADHSPLSQASADDLDYGAALDQARTDGEDLTRSEIDMSINPAQAGADGAALTNNETGAALDEFDRRPRRAAPMSSPPRRWRSGDN